MAFPRKRGGVWCLYRTQDSRKRGRSLKTKSKTVTDEYLKEFEYRLSERELGQELDATLGSLKTEYLAYCKATKKSSTYERHEQPRITRFIDFLESKGVRKVSEITEAHAHAYQQHLLGEAGLTATTVRHTLYAASGLLSISGAPGTLWHEAGRNGG